MSSAAILAAAFPALLMVGVLLAPLFAPRERSRRYPSGPGSRHADPGHARVNDRTAPISMPESRLADEAAGDDAAGKGDQYFIDWAALQARFNEEPA